MAEIRPAFQEKTKNLRHLGAGCLFVFKPRPLLVHDYATMQTLNVGAGRTDEEYQAAEESRREELRGDVQTSAFYFFIAAICASLGTGVLLIKLNLIVNIGAIDLLAIYGRDLLHGNILLFRLAGAAWVVALLLLGLAARNNHRWAFWAGIILYGADLLCTMVLLSVFTIFALGVHGFFIMQWFKGQKALGELKESQARAAAAAAR